MTVFEKITAQQKGAEGTAPWMVGEQLKEICLAEPGAAEIVSKDLDVKEMSLAAFKTLQGELHALNETLSKIEERDGALGAKLRGALRQILAPFAGSETSSGAATARTEEETE